MRVDRNVPPSLVYSGHSGMSSRTSGPEKTSVTQARSVHGGEPPAVDVRSSEPCHSGLLYHRQSVSETRLLRKLMCRRFTSNLMIGTEHILNKDCLAGTGLFEHSDDRRPIFLMRLNSSATAVRHLTICVVVTLQFLCVSLVAVISGLIVHSCMAESLIRY